MVCDLIIKRHFICFTPLNALAVPFWTDQCPKYFLTTTCNGINDLVKIRILKYLLLLLSLPQPQIRGDIEYYLQIIFLISLRWMNGWMTCDFTSFVTVFQSYQDDVWVKMRGCVQWNSFYGWKDFTSSEDRTWSARSVGQRLTHWATGAPIFLYENICCDPSSEPSRRDGSNAG